jgi:hypothetical protein
MAETNLDAIRKQKNAEYSKRYRLKRKMQQQAPITSEAEQNYKYSFCLMVQATDHVYVLPRTYTCHTDLPAKI